MNAITKSPVIAIIEDDVMIVQMYRAKLKFDGFTVVSAGDGLSGLHLVKQAKPDIILLDLMLPLLGGSQFVERLHKLRLDPMPKVVVLTNIEDPKVEKQLRQQGVDAFLIKAEVTPRQIAELIHQLLHSS